MNIPVAIILGLAILQCSLVNAAEETAQPASETVADAFRHEAEAPFMEYRSPSVIREQTAPEKACSILLDLAQMSPSYLDLEEQQLMAIDLFEKLKDPKAFETLFRVSRFGSGYSSTVQLSARGTLIRLMPIFNDLQGQQILQSLQNDRDLSLQFHLLSNGTLGDIGLQADQAYSSLITQATEMMRQVPELRDSQEKPSLCMLNYVEAGKAFAKFPLELMTAPVRLFIANPVKFPTRLIGGLLFSLADVFLDARANAAGLLPNGFNGYYGNRGQHLGRSLANTAAWIVGGKITEAVSLEHIPQFSRRFPIEETKTRPVSIAALNGLESMLSRLETTKERILIRVIGKSRNRINSQEATFSWWWSFSESEGGPILNELRAGRIPNEVNARISEFMDYYVEEHWTGSKIRGKPPEFHEGSLEIWITTADVLKLRHDNFRSWGRTMQLDERPVEPMQGTIKFSLWATRNPTISLTAPRLIP